MCVCAHSYSKQGCEQRPVEEVHLQRVGMGGKAAGRDWAVKAIASLAKEKLQGNYRTPNVCIRHYDVYVYTHTKHVYICTHTCIHMCMCMCIYLSAYVHVFIHIHPHALIPCLSSGGKVVVRKVGLRRMTQVIEALNRG